MGYKVTARLRIDLGDLGEDQNGVPFFVEIQHPRLLTWPQKMEAAKFQVPEGKTLTSEERQQQINDMVEYVRSFVKAWNLLDMDTEQLVTLTDEKAFEKIPGEVVERVLMKFQEFTGKQDEETKNS